MRLCPSCDHPNLFSEGIYIPYYVCKKCGFGHREYVAHRDNIEEYDLAFRAALKSMEDKKRRKLEAIEIEEMIKI